MCNRVTFHDSEHLVLCTNSYQSTPEQLQLHFTSCKSDKDAVKEGKLLSDLLEPQFVLDEGRQSIERYSDLQFPGSFEIEETSLHCALP